MRLGMIFLLATVSGAQAQEVPSPTPTPLKPCVEASAYEPCVQVVLPAQRLSERLDRLEASTQEAVNQLAAMIESIRSGQTPIATPAPKEQKR